MLLKVITGQFYFHQKLRKRHNKEKKKILSALPFHNIFIEFKEKKEKEAKY